MRQIIGILACVMFSSVLGEQKVERPADNVVHMVSPRYSHKAGRSRIGGTCRYRMITDFKTGKVRNVAVLQSTGSDPLDLEAIFALRQWRFKPGKLTKVDLPITFHAGGTLDLPPGARVVPNR